MPNWCSNRMYFSGEPAQIAEIKRLASGAVTPLYRRATNEGIQLFLAGSAGLLQTTENVRFEPVAHWSTGMPNRAVISVAGSCMSAESSLMCCGGNWNGLPRQMTMSCRKSPDLRG